MTTLAIDGMLSVHCVRAVFTALGGVPGVVRAEVSMGSARIEHDGELDVRGMHDALAAVGYTLRDLSTDRRRLTIREDGSPE